MKNFLEFLTESLVQDDKFDQDIGQILRNYGNIPLSKDRAAIVIQKIIGSELKYSHDLEHGTIFPKPDIDADPIENSNFNLMKSANKVRMFDYLRSLMRTKTIRGDSFEGLIAGLYNGQTAQAKHDDSSSRWDVEVETPKNHYFLSVKFLDSKNERPVLGNIKSFIMKDKKGKILLEQGLSLNEVLGKLSKREQFNLLNTAFENVTHFLFAYPETPDGLDIRCRMFERESLIRRYILDSKVRYAPKQKGSYQIRVNIDMLRKSDPYDQSWLLLAPDITKNDLEYLKVSDENSAEKLLGSDRFRMRGSILNAMLKYGEFKKRSGKEYFVFDFEKYKEDRGH